MGRTVRLVPLAWVRGAASATTPVTLDADRVMVAGCPPVRPDADLRADVVAALAADSRLRPLRLTRLSSLQVAVAEGTASLTGYLPDASYARAARSRAAAVPGVLGVVDHTVADLEVGGAVAQALVADADTRRAHLTVTSRLGQVTLSGRVPSAAAQARAGALAAAVRGTAGVHDYTTVSAVSAPARRPAHAEAG
jgi:osmotically-inducible protein OsmY